MDLRNATKLRPTKTSIEYTKEYQKIDDERKILDKYHDEAVQLLKAANPEYFI